MASDDPVYDDFVKQCRQDDELAAAIAANSFDGELIRSVNLEVIIHSIYKDEQADILGKKTPLFCPPSLGEERLERAFLAARDLDTYDPDEFPSLEYLKARFHRDLAWAVRHEKAGNSVLFAFGVAMILFTGCAGYVIFTVIQRLGNY